MNGQGDQHACRRHARPNRARLRIDLTGPGAGPVRAAHGRSCIARPSVTSNARTSAQGGGPLMAGSTLYARLGGYDAIAAVCDDLLPRLMSDSQLGRFWMNRAADSIRREKQLLVDYLCASAGGPVYYTGRDMTMSHKGMGISAGDWDRLLGHLRATLDKFKVPEAE